IRHDIVPWNLQAKNIGGEERTGASSAGRRAVIGGLSGVAARKALEHREARNKCRVECASLRQTIRIGSGATGERCLREERTQATGSAATEGDGQKGRL